MQQIELAKIRLDGGTQPRAEINNEVVSEYRERMEAGDTFPPIGLVYDGTDYWCWDGHHRVLAARRSGAKTIAANVQQGTQRDAVLYSVGANGSHGLRRSNADKRRAVETVLRDEEWRKWSDRRIAEACGVSHNFVGEVRRALSSDDNAPTRTTSDGRQYPSTRQASKPKPASKSQASEPSPNDAETDEAAPQSAAPAKPQPKPEIDKYPWESFNREVREQVAVVRREVDRLARILGHKAKSFSVRWAYFISADGTIGVMRRALDSIDDNLPGGPHPKEPGFEPYRSVKMRSK